MITSHFLQEHFEYDDGILRRKKAHGRYKVGDVVGALHTKGYLRTQIKRKSYYVHRLIWCMHHGNFPKNQIDHIDGNKINNRIDNLREATNQQNLWNIKYKKSISGHRHVLWNKNKYCWQVAFPDPNKKYKYYINTSNIETAISIATQLRQYYHKEFARHD
jgi:hypothetical protein